MMDLQSDPVTDSDGTPPTTFAELTARIHTAGSALTPSYRALARRILQDPEGVAFLSVGEFAEAAGVNMSTVSRFAKYLGLPGYPALRQLCEEELRVQSRMVHRLASVTDADGEIWQRSAWFDEQNIARTFSRIDPDSFRAATAALSTAGTVHVLGLRKSHSAAQLLWFLLQLVRDDVRLITPDTVVEQARTIKASDTLVTFGLHRYSRYTILACQYAHQRGATTVALTDNAASPLVAAADHPFLVDTAGPGVLRSMTAFISLAQALAAGVAAHRGTASREALTTAESLLEHFGIYHEHELHASPSGEQE